jgi:hypothetical protein
MYKTYYMNDKIMSINAIKLYSLKKFKFYISTGLATAFCEHVN